MMDENTKLGTENDSLNKVGAVGGAGGSSGADSAKNAVGSVERTNVTERAVDAEGSIGSVDGAGHTGEGRRTHVRHRGSRDGRSVSGTSDKGHVSGNGNSGNSGKITGDGKRGRGNKIIPVTPSQARLAKRANDEKIIRNIKIAFMSVVIVAILGVAVSLFLFNYVTPLGTVAGKSVEQSEFTYYANLMQMNAMMQSYQGLEVPEVTAQDALTNATEVNMMSVIADEKGIKLTDVNRQAIQTQIDSADIQAQSMGGTEGTPMTGAEYIRDAFGISLSDYRKVLEKEQLAANVQTAVMDEFPYTEEQARADYDADITNYREATVRHIVFLFGANTDVLDETGVPIVRTDEETLLLAEDTVRRIEAGEDMATLVQELSEDTDLSNEGIYVVRPNQPYEKTFLDWSFAPERTINEVGIVEAPYGCHVMRYEGKRDQIPFEEVMAEIINSAKSEHFMTQYTGWQVEPRFQVQLNQQVFDKLNEELFGIIPGTASASTTAANSADTGTT